MGNTIFQPSSEPGEKCLDAELFDTEQATPMWLWIYLGFTVVSHLNAFNGAYHQYHVVKDVEAREEDFKKFPQKLQDGYPWEKAYKSLLYNRKLFGFLCIRELVATLPFEFCFFYFYGPAHIWNYYLTKLNEWGSCTEGDGSQNI